MFTGKLPAALNDHVLFSIARLSFGSSELGCEEPNEILKNLMLQLNDSSKKHSPPASVHTLIYRFYLVCNATSLQTQKLKEAHDHLTKSLRGEDEARSFVIIPVIYYRLLVLAYTVSLARQTQTIADIRDAWFSWQKLFLAVSDF